MVGTLTSTTAQPIFILLKMSACAVASSFAKGFFELLRTTSWSKIPFIRMSGPRIVKMSCAVISSLLPTVRYVRQAWGKEVDFNLLHHPGDAQTSAGSRPAKTFRPGRSFA